jgi:hypothetical protein
MHLKADQKLLAYLFAVSKTALSKEGKVMHIDVNGLNRPTE